MKKTALALLLAAAPAAQPWPCFGPVPEYWSRFDPTGRFNLGTLNIRWHSYIDFVPTGNGIAVIALFGCGEEYLNYHHPRAFTLLRPECEEQRFVWLGTWWDDHWQVRPGDTMRVNGLTIDLHRSPTGWLFRPVPIVNVSEENEVTPFVSRATWNPTVWRPDFWAVLIAPERGYW